VNLQSCLIILEMGDDSSDTLNLGERPTAVHANDQELFSEACEYLWGKALQQESCHNATLKIAMTQVKVDQLRLSTRRELTRMVARANAQLGNLLLGPAAVTVNGPELFFMVVNHFFHSESHREFRLPMGSLPVHRTNNRRRVVNCLGGPANRFHANCWLNSLILCLVNVCNVGKMLSWLPLHVRYEDCQAAQVNMRRRQIATTKAWLGQGWKFGELFYAGLYALLFEDLVRGEVRRVFGGDPHGSEGKMLNRRWFERSHTNAINLGFLPQATFPTLATLCHLQLGMQDTHCPPCGSCEGLADLLLELPRFMENPTAYLEKMWYMQDYAALVHHCCYCKYGAPWRKPTTFWIRKFDWPNPSMCNSTDGHCTTVLEAGSHSERIGGGDHHSMQQKWHVPFQLCVELLQGMRLARPVGRSPATWFLTLFGGAGSFNRPCRDLGLMHVSVSYDRPSCFNEGSEEEGTVHICMDLKEFRLAVLLDRVWALTGLHATNLLGYGCHPGCETFSLMDSYRRTRDHSAQGFHLAITPEAMEADAVTHNAATQLFPGMEGGFQQLMDGLTDSGPDT
jgi:hypothetical protein